MLAALQAPSQVRSPTLWPRLDNFSSWLCRCTSMVAVCRCPRPGLEALLLSVECATDGPLASQLAAAVLEPTAQSPLPVGSYLFLELEATGSRRCQLRLSDWRSPGVGGGGVRERHGELRVVTRRGTEGPDQHQEVKAPPPLLLLLLQRSQRTARMVSLERRRDS